MRIGTLITVFILLLIATFVLGFMLGAQAKMAAQETQAIAQATPALAPQEAAKQQRVAELRAANNPFYRQAVSVQNRLERLGLIDKPDPAAPAISPAPAPTSSPPTSTDMPTAPPPQMAAAASVPSDSATPAPFTNPQRSSLLADPPAGSMARVLRPPPLALTEEQTGIPAPAAAPLGPPSSATSASAQARTLPAATYTVEVAASSDSVWADQLVAQLLLDGEAAYQRIVTLPDGGLRLHVRVGAFTDTDQASITRDRLVMSHGLNGTVLRIAGQAGPVAAGATP